MVRLSAAESDFEDMKVKRHGFAAAASCAAITLIARLLAVLSDFTRKETGKYESS